MKDFYLELFDYNHQMNQQLIAAFNVHSDKVSERSVQWLNHILNAHQVWISRIDKQQEPLSPWHVHSPGFLKDLDLANYGRSVDILNSRNMAENIPYINFSGKSFSNAIKDILFHVINHSTYHRGQIASDFRISDLQPFVSDYIAFKR